jgi:hypothetical protein
MKSEFASKAIESVAGMQTQRTRGRKTLQARLEEIIEQQAKLGAQRRAIAAQQRLDARAREAHLESTIGEVVRRDPSLHQFVKPALDKNVKDPKVRAFLKAEGWL